MKGFMEGYAFNCRRAASTKTRIETLVITMKKVLDMCRRAASTKTRIETSTITHHYSLIIKSQGGIH